MKQKLAESWDFIIPNGKANYYLRYKPEWNFLHMLPNMPVPLGVMGAQLRASIQSLRNILLCRF